MTDARNPHPPGSDQLSHPPRIALVGDRSTSVQAHVKIPLLLDALARRGQERIEAYWLHSTSVSGPGDVAGFDGVWVVPGSPYEDRDGVLAAVEGARRAGLPFLGTCGGFQYLLLELARNVCGLGTVEHAEEHPDASDLLVVPLACALLGEEASVVVKPGTVAAAAMGAGQSTERFFCRYGLDERYLGVLEGHGLVVSGRDEQGAARIVELAGHRFFVGSLFQPELSSDATWVHPLIAAFAAAVRARATDGALRTAPAVAPPAALADRAGVAAAVTR